MAPCVIWTESGTDGLTSQCSLGNKGGRLIK